MLDVVPVLVTGAAWLLVDVGRFATEFLSEHLLEGCFGDGDLSDGFVVVLSCRDATVGTDGFLGRPNELETFVDSWFATALGVIVNY